MKIAILGATSQIAKDLVLSFSVHSHCELVLFARRPEAVTHWLTEAGHADRYVVAGFDEFGTQADFDAILNFVGVGNPAQTALLGSAIFDITLQYDQMALDYVQVHPACRYIFLSSGAAYGAGFHEPASQQTKAVIPINDLQAQDWYAVAKLYAECRHRALPDLAIIDIRVFNYFSCTQDMSARFLICDIVRAIAGHRILRTSPDYIVRDYLHPVDFYRLLTSLLSAPPVNAAVDCYSLAPIDKPGLLSAMQEKFGLRYEIVQTNASVNATGNKPHYYSLNTRAADFGYQPTLTSLAGIVKETQIILQKWPENQSENNG